MLEAIGYQYKGKGKTAPSPRKKRNYN